MLDWDALTAVTLVVAALIFGALIALSGRSAIGSWIAGGVLSLVGVILLVADPVAYAGLGSEVLIILTVLGWSGAILAVGMTVLGLALGITLRVAASAGAERHTASDLTQDAAPGAV
jgi:hypothetical protein